MKRLTFSEYTPEERRVWLEHPITQGFLMFLEEMANDYREASVRGLNNGQNEGLMRATAGSYVALDRAISTAKDVT